MLRERYEPINLFEFVPALAATVDPVLTTLDHLLDDDQLFQLVKADLLKRFPQTSWNGRPSTPVEVILRMLVVKHLYAFSYAQTEQWVSDSLVLRQFCRIYVQRVPDDTTLIRWANLIKPETLPTLLDHIVELARQLKVTRGRKLRIDGTVVETNIHHPTDSTLLGDGVRVLSRGLRKARELISETTQRAKALFRDRTISAKRAVKQIMDTSRQRLKKGLSAEEKTGQMQQAYGRLLETSRAVVAQTRQVLEKLKRATDQKAASVRQSLEEYVSLVEQVIEQTSRRVIQGESVPASEKIVSLFEPHSAIIRKGKISQPTEFGRGVWLDEVEGGIITRYEVLKGNPPEHEQVWPSLDHHHKQFGKPPHLVVGDRGIHSAAGEAYATEQGVKRVVLPKPGKRDEERIALEKEGWYKRGCNWRAGIEGRISGLKRSGKLGRCRNRGSSGMERWVGWGVISHDLWQIAKATAA